MKKLLIALCALHFALIAPLALADTTTCTEGSCGAGKFCAIDTRLPGGSACYPSCSLDSSGATPCNVGYRCVSVTGQGVCVLPDSPFVTGVTKTDATTPAVPTTPEVPFTSITPALGVDIPGLALSPAVKTGDSVSLPFLAQYINAAYKYMVTVVLIVAIVMVVYGGFRYLVGASMGDVKSGKKIIMDALGGMLIVLGAYMILNTVNPETLNLKVLDLAFVKTGSMDSLLEDVGNLADDASYEADGGSVDVPPGAPGSWRDRMTQRSLCIGNGLSLPTKADKVSALRRIVDTYKQVGLDEGGAIYIRGGRADCRDVSLPDPRQTAYFVATLTTAEPITALSSVGISESCLAPIRRLKAITSRPERLAQVDIVVAAQRGECRVMWETAYNRLTTGLARERGLLCGDCASAVAQMYKCFDTHANTNTKRPKSGNCQPNGSESDYVFFLKPATPGTPIGQTALNNVIRNLRFGDIISYCMASRSGTGHVFMYTGGVGLPYEIIEMGAGGGGPALAGGSAKAKLNSGTPFSVSGFKVTASASVFLGEMIKKHGIGSLAAWRIIPD